MSLQNVHPRHNSSAPRWIKKKIAVSHGRFLADRVDSMASRLNWPAAAQYVCTELHFLQQEAEKHIDFPYRYSVWQSPSHSQVKQITFTAIRKNRIWVFDETSSDNLKSEREKPARLSISQASDGTIAVIAFPHSTSDGNLQDGESIVLELFQSSDEMRTWRGKRRVRKMIALFLELHHISAFEAKHRRADWLRWRKLTASRTRYERLVRDPKEGRLERLRLDFSFGAAFTAAALVLGMQLLTNVITKTQKASLTEITLTLIVLSIGAGFLYLLVRKASRI